MKPRTPKAAATHRAGWRVDDWVSETGLGRSATYGLIKDRKIKSVKAGRARIILTSPSEFLTSLLEA